MNEDFVETSTVYTLEEFSIFSAVRMNHKPEQDTAVDLLFVRKGDQIRVIAGFSPGTTKPSSRQYSHFKCTLTFEVKFVKELREDNIETLC